MMVLVAYFCLRGDRWFPILDSANLVFHEFGHPFFGALHSSLMVYGGTLGQLVFPAVVSFSFFRRADTFQMSVGILWLAENFLNIATYMRDARAQQLPLVGGGQHDWTEILSRWGCLQSDIKISDHLIKLIIISLLIFTFWLYHKIEGSPEALSKI